MIRSIAPLILVAAIAVAGCSRTTLRPTVEPARVSVEIARPATASDRIVAVRVPRAAVVEVDPKAGSGVVWVVEGDRAIRRSVAVGDISDRYVDVLSGVAIGAEVITRGTADLHDGDHVQTVSRSGA
jgi:hypothetical protein